MNVLFYDVFEFRVCTSPVVVSRVKIPKWIYDDDKNIMFGAAGYAFGRV